MKKDYLSRTDDAFDTWEENFLTQLALVAAAVGLTPAQIVDIPLKINEHRALFSAATTAKNAAHAATVTARNKRKILQSDLIRPLVRQIKASPGYTAEIGENLDIIGEESTVDWSVAKPTLKVKIDGGNIVISFNKGQSNGIKLYSKQGNQTEFSFLAVDTESPYVDNRPRLSSSPSGGAGGTIPTPGTPGGAVAAAPENREYQAYYLIGDDTVGLLSDTVRITLP